LNLPTQISVSGASLPRTYQAAQLALSECSQIDECKDWADKAAALASYARQSEDQELERMAQRIRARAIRRAGELLKQIEPATGKNNQYVKEAGDRPLHSRTEAARDAGMSPHQHKQAMRVANIAPQEFERQVESHKPPTLSQLASQGVKPRENIIDLKGRDPSEFNRAMHYVGAFERVAKELAGQPHDQVIPTLNEKERQRLRAAIQQIDAIADKTITRI
jgi:hypothetical protein